MLDCLLIVISILSRQFCTREEKLSFGEIKNARAGPKMKWKKRAWNGIARYGRWPIYRCQSAYLPKWRYERVKRMTVLNWIFIPNRFFLLLFFFLLVALVLDVDIRFAPVQSLLCSALNPRIALHTIHNFSKSTFTVVFGWLYAARTRVTYYYYITGNPCEWCAICWWNWTRGWFTT